MPAAAWVGEPAHLLAIVFQTRRAFVQLFHRLIGGSAAAARLRAEAWHSIFTHNRVRHARHLSGCMRDSTTLITGPSGTGKEVVASVRAASQYRAFDPRALAFASPGVFAPINLAAVSEGLVKSELFGHKRGSFTGASVDRRGLLDQIDRGGCVFLDEIGELAPAVQVKLLRVGDLKPRRFDGKIIAATNRDRAADMDSGTFRRDLYYRLSGDLIRTPTLHQQVAGDPEELGRLVAFVSRQVVGPAVSREVAAEAIDCIAHDLGHDDAWPGNFRELEQCVRNVLVRRCYTPPTRATPGAPGWLDRAATGALSADKLVDVYATHVYRRTGSYAATGRALNLDRRTIKSRVTAASDDVA